MRTRIIDIALSEIGVKEIVGKKHNPRILHYFSEIGHAWVKNDETAWCSAFANYVCKKAGVKYSGKLNARSWEDIGEKIINPEKGDIAVFWRESPDSWKGHVAFFIRQTKNWVYVLGGNQGNQVKISAYPKNRLLEYRSV